MKSQVSWEISWRGRCDNPANIRLSQREHTRTNPTSLGDYTVTSGEISGSIKESLSLYLTSLMFSWNILNILTVTPPLPHLSGLTHHLQHNIPHPMTIFISIFKNDTNNGKLFLILDFSDGSSSMTDMTWALVRLHFFSNFSSQLPHSQSCQTNSRSTVWPTGTLPSLWGEVRWSNWSDLGTSQHLHSWQETTPPHLNSPISITSCSTPDFSPYVAAVIILISKTPRHSSKSKNLIQPVYLLIWAFIMIRKESKSLCCTESMGGIWIFSRKSGMNKEFWEKIVFF